MMTRHRKRAPAPKAKKANKLLAYCNSYGEIEVHAWDTLSKDVQENGPLLTWYDGEQYWADDKRRWLWEEDRPWNTDVYDLETVHVEHEFCSEGFTKLTGIVLKPYEWCEIELYLPA